MFISFPRKVNASYEVFPTLCAPEMIKISTLSSFSHARTVGRPSVTLAFVREKHAPPPPLHAAYLPFTAFTASPLPGVSV